MRTGDHLSPKRLKHDADTLYPGGPVLRRLIQVHRPLICPFGEIIAQVPDGAELLDIGCGSGLFVGLLAHHRDIKLATGFDASAQAISLAKRMQKAHAKHDRMSFEHRSVGTPWPDQAFDVISIIDLFHHLAPDDQAATFKNAVDHLKPGGVLIFKDVGRTPAWRAFFSRLHDLVVAQERINIPSDHDVKGWGNANNMTLQARSTHNMLWYGHELWVFKKPVS